MERYSRLCQISRSGSRVSEQELSSSEGLGNFMRQLGIVNLRDGLEVVSRELADFRKLSRTDGLPDEEQPMLIRYSPFRLAERPGWARDVKPFLALCGCGPDGSGKLYHHTSFFRPELLLNDDAYSYLDHLFGTRFDGIGNPGAADPDCPPDRVEPVHRAEDALTVKLAAAALLKDWPVVLKLEKDCVFNSRAMELLSQIYSLIPPELAVWTGYASYQDPRQLDELLRSSPIRIFLTHSDCVCSAEDPRYLYFDLNQPVNIQMTAQQTKGFQVSKNLFTYITYWHSMPWRERQPLMKLLFSDDQKRNEESYCSITRNFVREPFIQWINRLPDRETYTTLEQLKEKYDSFPICERVPILREKFCLTVPQLLKPPLTVDALGADLRLRLDRAGKESEEYARLQELNGFFRLIQAVRTAANARKAQAAKGRPGGSAAELAALQEAHAEQLREMEQSFAEQISRLSAEIQALNKASEQGRMELAQEAAWKIHEAEQAFAGQVSRLKEENEALRKAHEEELAMVAREVTKKLREKDQERVTLEQNTAWKIHEVEQSFTGQIDKLKKENEALRKAHAEQLQNLHSGSETALAEKNVELAKQEQAHAEQIAKLRSEADAAQARLQAARDKIVQLIRDRDSALEQQKEDQDLRERMNRLIAFHAEKTAAFEKEKESLCKKNAELLEQMDCCKKAALAEKNEALAKQEQAHAGQIAKLRSEADAAQAKLQLSRDKIVQLIRDRDSALEQAKQEQAARLTEARTRQTELEEKLELQEKELRDLRERMNQLIAFDAKKIAAYQTEAQKAREDLDVQAQAHAKALEEMELKYKADLADMTAQQDQMRQEHEDAVSRLNMAHEKWLVEAERKHKENLAKAHNALRSMIDQRDAEKAVHEADLRQLTEMHKQEMAAMKAAHQADLTNIHAAMEEQEKLACNAYEEALGQLKRKHQDELTAAAEAYRKEREQFAADVRTMHQADLAKQERLQAELEECRQERCKAEQDLKQAKEDLDLEKHIRDKNIQLMKHECANRLAEMAKANEENIAKAKEAVRQINEKHNKTCSALQAELEECKNVLDKTKTELAEARARQEQDVKTHDESSRRLTQQYQSQLAALEKRNEENINRTNEAIRSMQKDHQEKLKAAEDKFKADVEHTNSVIRSMVEEKNLLFEHCQALEAQLKEARKNKGPSQDGGRSGWWRK